MRDVMNEIDLDELGKNWLSSLQAKRKWKVCKKNRDYLWIRRIERYSTSTQVS